MVYMTTSPSPSGNIFQPALRAMQFRQRLIVTCWSGGPKSSLWVMCGRLRVGKDFLHVLQHWSVQPCVRPFDAVHMTAGHNALRGSGPDQTPNRGSLNCSHSRGTLVPVEEPSTASNSEVSLPARHVRCLRSRRRQAAPGMSPWCQQPTFDISSSFASRNHVAHALVDCLLYSLDKRRPPLTIKDGAPRPVGANVKRERATCGQPVALPVYARRFGAAYSVSEPFRH